MTKKKTLLLAAALVGVLILLFSLAYAHAPRSRLSERIEKLGLSDKQISDMKEIQYNFRKTQIGLVADLKTSRLELRHLMMQEKPDQSQITKTIDGIAEAQKSLLKNNVDTKLAMKAVLTPEQFKKFMQRRAEWTEEKMEQGRRHFGHRSVRPGEEQREGCPGI
ncbi:MAG: periplasmic heavy metal sensor [Candidatus Zixiibacteriota bacterium]